ncbi:MAG: hypothetical protein GON13_03995 [Nanoarchaeota archaeon]|nr:hypothetical protein [Nanoarchaeota archaeon]
MSSEMYPFQLSDNLVHKKDFLRDNSNIESILGEDSKKIDILEKRGINGLVDITRMNKNKGITYFEEDNESFFGKGFISSWDFKRERWYTFSIEVQEGGAFLKCKDKSLGLGWVHTPEVFQVGMRGLKTVLKKLEVLKIRKISYSKPYEYV